MKFKVGDIVRVRSDLKKQYYGDLDVVSEMLEFRGEIVHISKIIDECSEYKIKEDREKWSWNDEMIEPVDEESISIIEDINKYADKYKDFDIIIKVKRKEPILDEKEKKYLSAVIRPFRDRVKHITKRYSVGYQFVCIYVEHIAKGYGGETVCLPFFKENTMYKGMVQNKEYTLEELGL